MAPSKTAKKVVVADAEVPSTEEIEEVVVPEKTSEQQVTFVLGDPSVGLELDDEDQEDDDESVDDDDDLDHEDGDHEDDEYDGDLVTVVGQLTQLMMTEEGEAISDVLNGLRDAIDKQNKILYRGLQLLEARFGRR